MGTQRQLLPVVAITGSSLLVGCGCGSGEVGSTGSAGQCVPATQAGSPAEAGVPPAAGIYAGTIVDATGKNSTPVVALVPQSGPALLSAQNGAFYSLNVGDAAAGSFSVSGSYTAFNTAGGLPNGGRSDSGTVSLVLGTNTLSGALTDQSGSQQGLTLTFDARYNTPVPSGALAGAWFNPTASGPTLTLNISPDGTLTGNDSNSCTYTGNLSSIDPSFDMLNASLTRQCSSGTDTFTGLASYLPAAGNTPAQLQLLADDLNGGYIALLLQPQ